MATGKYAYSICQRSGLRFPYNEMVREPGTNLWVHESESDGSDNLVDLAKPKRRWLPEKQALDNIYPETPIQNTEFFLVDEDGNFIISEGDFGVTEHMIEGNK